MWKLFFSNTGLVLGLAGTLAFKIFFSKKRRIKKAVRSEEAKEEATMQRIRKAIIEGYEVGRRQEEEREAGRRRGAVEDDSYE
jgi:hypothetical protein